MSGEQRPPNVGHPSPISQRVGRLKSSAFRVSQKRAKVPHPLFWSLLHSEVGEIKRMKAKARLEREAWLNGDSSAANQTAPSVTDETTGHGTDSRESE